MKRFSVMLLGLGFTFAANAAIIAGYDFDDGTSNATQAVTVKDANVTAGNYTTGAGLNDNVNGPNGNSNFSNLDAEGNVFGTANGFEFGSARSVFGFTDMNNGNNLSQAINQNDYMTFTVTPGGEYKMNLNSFTFRTRVNQVNNSAERWALFSSVDGFTSGDQIQLGRTTTISTYINNVIDLSDLKFQNLTGATEFRLVIYGGNNAGSSATLFDKVILNGAVEAIPEPAAMTLVVATGLGFLFLKRRFTK